jgi:hypothetical protein
LITPQGDFRPAHDATTHVSNANYESPWADVSRQITGLPTGKSAIVKVADTKGGAGDISAAEVKPAQPAATTSHGRVRFDEYDYVPHHGEKFQGEGGATNYWNYAPAGYTDKDFDRIRQETKDSDYELKEMRPVQLPDGTTGWMQRWQAKDNCC